MIAVLASGCEHDDGRRNHTGTGALAGGAIGAGAGALIGGRHAGAGALIGGTVGALSGALIGTLIMPVSRSNPYCILLLINVSSFRFPWWNCAEL